LAPALSGAPHRAQVNVARVAPHDEQNFPVALAPQVGHFMG
jgi:hypothetical protein